MDDSNGQLSTMRLYGSSIAVVSGGYSLYLATTGPDMSLAAWFMLLLGIVVLGHGVLLVTPLAARLGRASGPLMIAYAVLMLLNQAWMLATNPMDGMGGMDGGMGPTGDMATMMGTGADAGMIAIALLMLASGIIMTSRRGMGEDRGIGEDQETNE